MPFILVGIAAVIALIYAAMRLFTVIDASHGALLASLALIICVILLGAAIVMAIRRHKALHGTTIDGQRRLHLDGGWGKLDLAIADKRGSLLLDGQSTNFIFADVDSALAEQRDGRWYTVVRLGHDRSREWPVPMANAATARRWQRVLASAADQTL